MKKILLLTMFFPILLGACLLTTQATPVIAPNLAPQVRPSTTEPAPIAASPTHEEPSCRIRLDATTTSDWSFVGIEQGGHWEDVEILSVSERAESFLVEEEKWILLKQECSSETECRQIQTVFDFTLKDFNPQGAIQIAIERGIWGMTRIELMNLVGEQPVVARTHTFDWNVPSGSNIATVEVPVASLCQYPVAQASTFTSTPQPQHPQPTTTGTQPVPPATPTQTIMPPTGTKAPTRTPFPPSPHAPTPTVDREPPNLLYVDIYPDELAWGGGGCPDAPRVAVSNLHASDDNGIRSVYAEMYDNDGYIGTVYYTKGIFPGRYYGEFGPFLEFRDDNIYIYGRVFDTAGNYTSFYLQLKIYVCFGP